MRLEQANTAATRTVTECYIKKSLADTDKHTRQQTQNKKSVMHTNTHTQTYTHSLPHTERNTHTHTYTHIEEELQYTPRNTLKGTRMHTFHAQHIHKIHTHHNHTTRREQEQHNSSDEKKHRTQSQYKNSTKSAHSLCLSPRTHSGARTGMNRLSCMHTNTRKKIHLLSFAVRVGFYQMDVCAVIYLRFGLQRIFLVASSNCSVYKI